jgi:hypothetical protein
MAPPSFPTLAEVAPARPAQGDTPATGPIYKVEYSADKDPSLGVATLQENFEYVVVASTRVHEHMLTQSNCAL